MQVSIPKQHYYVVSKLGRRLVDLGVGKVALSWVGVNGREERQIVENVMERSPNVAKKSGCDCGASRHGRITSVPSKKNRVEKRRNVCARA